MARTIKQALAQISTLSRCPSCGHISEAKLGEVKQNPEFACPDCGGKRDLRESAAWLELRVRRDWLKRVA
jgi:DNA-directed RNA polymerase subunit RPC12/RpoP